MKRALLVVVATTLLGCDRAPSARTLASPPSVIIVAEAPPAPVPTPAPAPVPAMAPPAPTAVPEPEAESWGSAALSCEGREACMAAAARVPKDQPPDIAANVRAKANGASGRCLVEAMMVAWNDDAEVSCSEDAKKAISKADKRLILATPGRAAHSWRRADGKE